MIREADDSSLPTPNSDPPDLSLANPEDRSVTLATFFILASQQGKGLGKCVLVLLPPPLTPLSTCLYSLLNFSAVMSEIETLARSPAIGAKKLTLNTISAYNATRPEFWASMGLPYDSKQRVNQHWCEF
jgi:GNAT superfamily N-acetyltransferase